MTTCRLTSNLGLIHDPTLAPLSCSVVIRDGRIVLAHEHSSDVGEDQSTLAHTTFAYDAHGTWVDWRRAP
jgi:hypothetical protein